MSVVLGLFWDTAVSMVTTWQRASSTFGDGFLILPTSVYLIWRRRQQVAILLPATHRWGLLLLLPPVADHPLRDLACRRGV